MPSATQHMEEISQNTVTISYDTETNQQEKNCP